MISTGGFIILCILVSCMYVSASTSNAAHFVDGKIQNTKVHQPKQVIRSCERKRRGITDSTLIDKICPYVQLGNRSQKNQQQKIIINITETSQRFIQ